MAICDLTKGRARVCKDGLGGNSRVYLFNFVEDPFTILNGEATAINILIAQVFEYELEGDGNSLIESIVGDRNTGTAVNTQTLVALIKKQDAATSLEFNFLAKNFPQAVVKDRNGVFHAIGLTEGIDFTIEATTGAAHAEFNGYTVTGVSFEGDLSPKLDTATIAALLLLIV